MLSEYVEYIQNIQDNLASENVFLPCNFSENSVANLNDNICIIQSFFDFSSIVKAYKTLQDESVSEYLALLFTNEYKESWQRQIQELLKEPTIIEATFESVDIVFEGFADDEEKEEDNFDGFEGFATEEEPMSWDEFISMDTYKSSETILDNIDNIAKVQNELPQKKLIFKQQTTQYMETEHIIEKMDTLLSSIFAQNN